MRTTISDNVVVLLGLALVFAITLASSSRYYLTLAEIQTTHNHSNNNNNNNNNNTNANIRYIFEGKANGIGNQNQSISADILNNDLRSDFYFEYSRSGGQINSIGKTISYNSTSNAQQILFTDSNGSVVRQDITNPKDLNMLVHLKQLIANNQHLFEKNIEYTNIVCNDCLEDNLTISSNKEPHFVTWYDRSSTKVPGIITEIAGMIVNLCSCGKQFR